MGKNAQQTKKTSTLKEKVDVIEYEDKSGCGSRSLEENFFVGKTQILSILKKGDKILCEFETMNRRQNKEVLVKQIMKKLTN